ncbi:MAG: hypothetical protein ABSG97_06095 [Sedimentisphaerales bacterium]|jgi:hypothetical protein
MLIPKFWEQANYGGEDRDGRHVAFSVWGWSCESAADAKELASERAKRAFDWWVNGGQRRAEYDYLDQPLREEIVETIGSDGDQTAVITRNRYGALVLNSASVCFVDVDFPKVQSSGFLDALKMMFSKRMRDERRAALRTATMEKVKSWAASNPKRAFRLYRTTAGFRLLFTDTLYKPTSDEVRRLLEGLGSDSLYRRLTEKQGCFRARLTAKPWRVGSRKPPNRYPWKDADAEIKYRKWQREYEAKCRAYGVCELVEVFGKGCADEKISTVVALHDKHTCTKTAAPLA